LAATLAAYISSDSGIVVRSVGETEPDGTTGGNTTAAEGQQMGQCIYVAETTGRPETRELPSEVWMNPAEAGRLLGEKHFLNTTLGVWFYESDLWDKQALRAQLLALVEHVTSPEFLKHYEDWGREQMRLRTVTPPGSKRAK
jgi:hypothetical protein